MTFCVAPTFLQISPCGAGRMDGCSFLSDQKGTKESPGDGSDERLRAAGAHSHLSPGPPDYGSGSLWPGSPFRRAKFEWLVCSIPGLLGPGSIKIWERLLSNAHRLVPAYSFGAWVIGRADGDIRPYAHSREPFCRGRWSLPLLACGHFPLTGGIGPSGPR